MIRSPDAAQRNPGIRSVQSPDSAALHPGYAAARDMAAAIAGKPAPTSRTFQRKTRTAPIFVKGRHWGGLRMSYQFD